MRYLGMALFAEGPTDHRFLGPILRRSAEQLCASKGTGRIDIGEVLSLAAPPAFRDQSREVRIVEAAKAARGAFSVLFVHSDAGGDAQRARRERVSPGTVRAVKELPGTAGVAVVPVRETEAWALADGAALGAAFGAAPSSTLDIPARPAEVEHVQDPKRVLKDAFSAVVGRRQGRKSNYRSALDAIAERVDLGLLRGVPAFRQFEAEFEEALRRLRFLPEPSLGGAD